MEKSFSYNVLPAYVSDLLLSLLFALHLPTGWGVWECNARGCVELWMHALPPCLAALDTVSLARRGEAGGWLSVPWARTVPTRKEWHGFCEQEWSFVAHNLAVLVHPTAGPRTKAGEAEEAVLALPVSGRWRIL